MDDYLLNKFHDLCRKADISPTPKRYAKFEELYHKLTDEQWYMIVLHTFFGGTRKTYTWPFVSRMAPHREGTTALLGAGYDTSKPRGVNKGRRYWLYITWNKEDHLEYSKGWVVHNA